MKISYNWLKEYIDLDGISPETLATKLTESGLEIEEVKPIAKGNNLVIAEVKDVKPHPDSDHLNVVVVNYGEGDVQIVCGAKNIYDAKKVIVAKVGAVLPDITIKVGKIRGVESNGMICSLFELGVDKKYLSEEQCNGIEILNDNALIGEDPLKYLGLDDVVLYASQTPNRADCMAMWSVAKEVGAVLRRKANLPDMKNSYSALKSSLTVESGTKNCPLFLGKIIKNVQVKKSPKWMVDYLRSAGIKSINNVVDISNFVMLETGQPLHFYDADKISQKIIRVVDDIEGNIVALDGIEYPIQKGDIAITNEGNIIGIAGIIGGDTSKIDENTKSIIIEAAMFNHVSIRNTANRLGIMTEASSRFIKGIEPLGQQKAIDRATDLLIELADASGIEETIQYGENNYKPTVVVETLTHCNKHLGTNYSIEEVVSVLKALDLDVSVENEKFTCVIPSYRTDLKIPEDLDEEIIRLIGYDSLNATLPTMVATIGQLDEKQKLERLTKSVMTSLGLSEIVTYSLVKEEYVNNSVLPFGKHIKLASPLSDDRKFVRNNLMPSILECVSYNSNRKATNINLFEISNVYEEDCMQTRLGIVLTDNLQYSKLHNVKISSDYYSLKGIIETYLKKIGIDDNRYTIEKNDVDLINFHPYRSAKIKIQDKMIGVFGEIHPLISKKWNLDRVLYAEIRLDLLNEIKTSKTKFVPIDKYPSVSRDIAIVIDRDLEVEKVIKVINSNSGKLVKSLEIFDVYTGEHIETNKKSIALRIVYQSKDKTLTESEVSEVHSNILAKLEEKLNAILRS